MSAAQVATRDDFVRELYGMTNGALRAMMQQMGLPPANPQSAKVYLVNEILLYMKFEPITDADSAVVTEAAPKVKHPLTLLYERVDSSLAHADSELYILKSELARMHPDDADEHLMMQRCIDTVRLLRTRLRQEVRTKWSL